MTDDYKTEAKATQAAKRSVLGIEPERPRLSNRMTDQEHRDFHAEAWRQINQAKEDQTK